MRKIFVGLLAMGASTILSSAHAEILNYTARLDGASETPPNASKGIGAADVTLDTVLRVVAWKVTFSGMGGPATMAHIHGPAGPGAAAGVQVVLSGPGSSPMAGSAPVNDGQIGDLRAGLWYVNVHTAANPKGEIRGQLSLKH